MHGFFSSFVLAVLPWTTLFLLAHCVWCVLAIGWRVALAELLVGVIGNAIVLAICLQIVGDPVPVQQLITVQFASFKIALDLLKGSASS